MEWINTEEKLPITGEKVLLIYGFRFASNKNNPFMTRREPIIGMYDRERDKWYAVDSVFSSGGSYNVITGDDNKTHKVVKWMPLPLNE